MCSIWDPFLTAPCENQIQQNDVRCNFPFSLELLKNYQCPDCRLGLSRPSRDSPVWDLSGA